jgi:hypothetical protein
MGCCCSKSPTSDEISEVSKHIMCKLDDLDFTIILRKKNTDSEN